MNHLKIRITSYRQTLILFAFWLFTFSYISAQKAQFQFFSNANEVSCGFIYDLHQDKEGFVWLLGENSDRYDGYNFVPISENENGGTFFNSQGDFKANSKNIIRLTDEYFVFQTLDDWGIDSVLFRTVLPGHAYFLDPFVRESHDGDLFFPYVDSLSKQFNFLKLEEGKLVQRWSDAVLTGKTYFKYTQLLFDTKGCTYINDDVLRQLLKYDPNGKLICRIPLPKTKFPAYIVEMGPDDDLWMVSHTELFEFNEQTKEFQLHPVTKKINGRYKINDLEIDKDGNLWVLGDDRHLLFYHKKEKQVYDYYNDLSRLIPRRVDMAGGMIDRTGVLWIKTILGVIKVVPQDELFDTYFDRETDECQGFCSFRGITEGDSGEIYASFYNGIYRINSTQWIWVK